MRRAAYGAGACALILLGALTTSASPVLNGRSVPFVTVAKGTTSRVHEPFQLVIRNSGSWGRLWIWIMPPERRPAAVDFGRDMVIALSSGPQPKPAVLTITRITPGPERIVVWYTLRQTRPLSEGGSTIVSAPFHIVRLARSSLPVEFIFLKTPPIL